MKNSTTLRQLADQIFQLIAGLTEIETRQVFQMVCDREESVQKAVDVLKHIPSEVIKEALGRLKKQQEADFEEPEEDIIEEDIGDLLEPETFEGIPPVPKAITEDPTK